MARRLIGLALGIWCCLLPVEAQVNGGCAGSPAASEMTLGVQAFKHANYAQAVMHLRAAVALDGVCTAARLYLGAAYLQQFIPGADSPDNLRMAASAREQFAAVLEKEPDNQSALASMASLSFNMNKLHEAVTWSKRLVEVNPGNKEAYYTLAVIAWTQAQAPISKARERSGMKPDDPGPVKPDAVREELRGKCLAQIQEGLDDIDRALEIDAEYGDAMAYANLLWRLKAELEESADAYQFDNDQANTWFQRVIDTRKARAQREP